MHMPVQRNKAIVGSNAFAHSSGIHQDGFLKHRENYEIMSPSDVGIEKSDIVLTARSGRHALRHRLELLGYTYDEHQKEEFEKVHVRFLNVADRQKEVADEDLHRIVTDTPVEVPEQYLLEDFRVTSSHSGQADANVRLHVSGETIEEGGVGDNQILAALNAVDRITKLPTYVKDIQTSSNGRDGAHHVQVSVGFHDQSFNSHASDTDVVKASIQAYLHSLNQLVARHGGLIVE